MLPLKFYFCVFNGSFPVSYTAQFDIPILQMVFCLIIVPPNFKFCYLSGIFRSNHTIQTESSIIWVVFYSKPSGLYLYICLDYYFGTFIVNIVKLAESRYRIVISDYCEISLLRVSIALEYYKFLWHLGFMAFCNIRLLWIPVTINFLSFCGIWLLWIYRYVAFWKIPVAEAAGIELSFYAVPVFLEAGRSALIIACITTKH